MKITEVHSRKEFREKLNLPLRPCLWCKKEAEGSPRDICWQCMRDEEKEDQRRDEIVTVGMLENALKYLKDYNLNK